MTDQAMDAALEPRKEPTPEERALAASSKLLERMKPAMAEILPSALGADRMNRLLYTEVRKNPMLALATPESFVGAVLTAVQLGLEPGSGTGDCWILPFTPRKGRNAGVTQAEFVLGYRGMVKLFWNHPLAHSIDTQTVYEGDEFDYAYGLNNHLDHRPVPPSKRGDVFCYYAVARFTNGGSHFRVMYPETVEEHRQRSNSPNSPAWRDDFEAMAHKTVLRSMFNLLPKSAELAGAISRDGTVRVDLDTDVAAEVPREPATQAADEPPALDVADGTAEPAEPAEALTGDRDE